MKRFTKKDGKTYTLKTLTQPDIYRLGKLDDLFERLGIKSVQDLKDRLKPIVTPVVIQNEPSKVESPQIDTHNITKYWDAPHMSKGVSKFSSEG